MNFRLHKFLVLFFIAFSIYGCSSFRPSPDKLYKRALKNQPYDVIIVPGVPYDGKRWSSIMKQRVIWATWLLEKGIANNVIFSGGAVYSPYIEGKAMALYAEQLGVPKEKIFVEDKAEHSTENIYYSYLMAKEMGFTKIAVATDPSQSNVLMGFTKRRFKLPIAHIPFVTDTLAAIDDVFPVIIGDSARVKDFKSILETQSKWYRFKGRMGRNIKISRQ